MCMLTLRVAALEEQLSYVVAKYMDTVASAKADMQPRSPQEDIAEGAVAINKIMKAQVTKQPIWSDVAKQLSDEDFVVVSRKNQRHKVLTRGSTIRAERLLEEPRPFHQKKIHSRC